MLSLAGWRSLANLVFYLTLDRSLSGSLVLVQCSNFETEDASEVDLVGEIFQIPANEANRGMSQGQ